MIGGDFRLVLSDHSVQRDKTEGVRQGNSLQLTGSADRVANLTPFFSRSLYFKASRPISVVHTGCNSRTVLSTGVQQDATVMWLAVQDAGQLLVQQSVLDPMRSLEDVP